MAYMLVGVNAHVQPSYRPLALGSFQTSSHFIAHVYGMTVLNNFKKFVRTHHTASPPSIARRINAQAPVHSYALNVQRFGFSLPVAGLG